MDGRFFHPQCCAYLCRRTAFRKTYDLFRELALSASFLLFNGSSNALDRYYVYCRKDRYFFFDDNNSFVSLCCRYPSFERFSLHGFDRIGFVSCLLRADRSVFRYCETRSVICHLACCIGSCAAFLSENILTHSLGGIDIACHLHEAAGNILCSSGCDLVIPSKALVCSDLCRSSDTLFCCRNISFLSCKR